MRPCLNHAQVGPTLRTPAAVRRHRRATHTSRGIITRVITHTSSSSSSSSSSSLAALREQRGQPTTSTNLTRQCPRRIFERVATPDATRPKCRACHARSPTSHPSLSRPSCVACTPAAMLGHRSILLWPYHQHTSPHHVRESRHTHKGLPRPIEAPDRGQDVQARGREWASPPAPPHATPRACAALFTRVASAAPRARRGAALPARPSLEPRRRRR